MVILKSQNKITDVLMILAWACPFKLIEQVPIQKRLFAKSFCFEPLFILIYFILWFDIEMRQNNHVLNINQMVNGACGEDCHLRVSLSQAMDRDEVDQGGL